MIGFTKTDLCFSTTRSLDTEGASRDFIDPYEARRAFKFKIERHQSYDEAGRPIPGQYHLRKSTNDSFIPSIGVGERYTPVQHITAYDFIVNDLMPKIPSMKLETVGTMYGCGTGIVMAKMGEDFRISGDDSPNSTRLFFSNPCNGRGSVVIGMTTVRLFCQNQISAARREAGGNGHRVKHTKNAALSVGAFLKTIERQVQLANDIRLRCERLSHVEADVGFVNRVLDSAFSLAGYEAGKAGMTRMENRRAEVLMQFEGGETAMSMRGKTAWSLFNAITFPIFNPSTIRGSSDKADIAYRGMDGSIAHRVKRIFNIVENATLAA